MTSTLTASVQPSPRGQSLELFRHVSFSMDCCLSQVPKYMRCTAAWNGEPK